MTASQKMKLEEEEAFKLALATHNLSSNIFIIDFIYNENPQLVLSQLDSLEKDLSKLNYIVKVLKLRKEAKDISGD